MTVIPRYLVETGPNSVETAFRNLPSLCSKHGVTQITLVVPKKGGWEHTLVAQALGLAAAKALTKGPVSLWKGGPTLRLESHETFSSSSVHSGLIVGAHVGPKTMAKIDDAPDAQAILYLPWNEVEGREWQATWQPETIGPASWDAPTAALSKEVEDELLKLTRLVNIRSMSHASDKESARVVIAGLRAAGHSIDPAEINRWALRHHWSSRAAAELEKIAKKHA